LAARHEYDVKSHSSSLRTTRPLRWSRSSRGEGHEGRAAQAFRQRRGAAPKKADTAAGTRARGRSRRPQSAVISEPPRVRPSRSGSRSRRESRRPRPRPEPPPAVAVTGTAAAASRGSAPPPPAPAPPPVAVEKRNRLLGSPRRRPWPRRSRRLPGRPPQAAAPSHQLRRVGLAAAVPGQHTCPPASPRSLRVLRRRPPQAARRPPPAKATGPIVQGLGASSRYR